MSIYSKIAGKRLDRLEALSDGLFAIAMTFLIMDLKEPASLIANSENQLIDDLLTMKSNFVAFVVSFVTLGMFWTVQSTQFTYIKNSDRILNWISLTFLMFVSMLPFTTALLSSHKQDNFSRILYGIHITVLALLLLIQWNYSRKKNYLIFDENEDGELIFNGLNKVLITAIIVYIILISLSFINFYACLIGLAVMKVFEIVWASFLSKKK
jgi:uncharacterized membrane protein